jgi:cold shock CspA family protein
MYRGKFKMFNTQKGFGFISSLEFPGNIFTHTNSIWLPPGEFPSGGDECTFDVGSDRYGRPVATNVQITRRVEDHAARVHHLEPERRQYQTRVMHPSGRLSSSPRHLSAIASGTVIFGLGVRCEREPSGYGSQPGADDFDLSSPRRRPRINRGGK